MTAWAQVPSGTAGLPDGSKRCTRYVSAVATGDQRTVTAAPESVAVGAGAAGAITVRWSPVAIADAYRVERFDPSGSPVVPIGACASPTTSNSCVESPAPPGTWTYAVRAGLARWSGPAGPTGAPVIVAGADTAPPTVTSAAVSLAEGVSSGWIRSSGSYRVFASASDDGAGATGVATVRADLTALTGASGLLELAPGGPWWVGGESFGWRSAPFTTSAGLVDGAERSFSVTATDGTGNAGSRSGKVFVDSGPPSTLDVQTTAGQTAGRAESGDRVIFTFSEPVDAASISAGWSGQSAVPVTVRITDGGSGNDVLTVWDATNTTQTAIGSVNLDRTDYVAGTVLFGSTSAPSTMALSGATVTVTLGAPNIAARVVAGSGTGSMVWTPNVAVTDRAGNPCTSATRTESGSRDREF